MRYSLIAAALASAVTAQSPAWGQCGGQGWTGATTCVAGYVCTYGNDFYSQCLPGTAASSSAAVTTKPTTTLVTSTTKTGSSATGGVTNAGNPLAGYSFYANPYYSSEVYSLASPSLVAKGSATWAAKATEVAKIGSFVWLDTRAKVPTIAQYAADVKAKNAAGAKLALPLVVYDLPDRDCAALASNGELSIANNGSALYKDYINSIVDSINKFPDVFFPLVIEPDSLANMVTNMNVAKCSNAASTYKELTVYALKALNLPNVAMYLDAGHAGWLGWEANIGPAATLFSDIYKQAGSPKSVRGLATNVANYNSWSSSTCASYTTPNANCDEKRYINAISPLLNAAGFPAHFIVDQGRSGKQPTGQVAWGDWCNAKGTGFGLRPTTSTDDPLLDAIVWVKPGGESDGTSDSTAVRYDGFCGKDDALKPAPEAGTWFQAYFEQLLVNANPAF